MSDGKAALAKAKARVRQIRQSIRAIEKKVTAGEPYPAPSIRGSMGSMSKRRFSGAPKQAKKLDETSSYIPVGWAAFLEAAESELSEAESTIKDLKLAVKVFRHNVETNQPFQDLADAHQ